MKKNETERREKLTWLPLKKLVALQRNPQYCTPQQMDSLKESLRRDGFLAPILVRPMENGRYEIVSGNHRVLASREAGLEDVPCVVVNMDDRTAKRVAINLNTIHGEPNVELLAPFLAEIATEDLHLVHLEDAMIAELRRFDEHLAQRLAELEPPDSLDIESSMNVPDCICPKCGRRHVPKGLENEQREDAASV